MIMPLFESLGEQEWNDYLRGTLYLLGLGWTFLGVAIVSDIFMAAIEKITSKKARVFDKETMKWTTVTVWNDTVANLTLMALGSSAPEILLNVIDIFKRDYYSGELGPSTIVGSAAFNLLVISAICVSAIPAGEIRYIKDTTVFAVTASCSIFAYIWLYLIVAGPWSKDVIEPWEGVATFVFFPILIASAFAADKGWFGGAKEEPETESRVSVVNLLECADVKEFAELEMQCVKRLTDNGTAVPEEQVVEMMEREYGPNRVSRAAYRIAGTRKMVGGKRVSTRRSSNGGIADELQRVSRTSETDGTENEPKAKCFIEFISDTYWVAENFGVLEITVRRYGDSGYISETSSNADTAPEELAAQVQDQQAEIPEVVPEVCAVRTSGSTAHSSKMAQPGVVKVRFKTRDGEARGGEDFHHQEGELEFTEVNETKTISIEIIDDTQTERVEAFFVDLFDPVAVDGKVAPELGLMKTATIKIIDDDYPGMLQFAEETLRIKEGTGEQVVSVKVERAQGAKGLVSCGFHTEDGSAIGGVDFDNTEGRLVFEDGQGAATIDLIVKARGRYDDSDYFRLVLEDPEGGVQFNKTRDGGEAKAICTVLIHADEKAKDRLDRVMKMIKAKMEKSQIGYSSWKDQFVAAIKVHGEEDDEDDSEKTPSQRANAMDWIMHILTIFWKILFAFIPPVDYCGGWLCFYCSLLGIGLVTAFVGDIAEMLGCVLGIPDSVTAVTLVALGTSLPDTFASKTAAEQDPYADASVGNVTGSNSVNVFLGIGIPWMIGSIFWTQQGRDKDPERHRVWEMKYRWAEGSNVYQENPEGNVFVVLSGSLGFSVIIFTSCALVAIGILVARRMTPSIGGELGGPVRIKYATSVTLFCLWFVFIGLYCLKALSDQDGC
jgi:solute carrier family 8 (sodium/calcium exchanger)